MLRGGRERSWMTCAEASLDGAAAGAGAGHAGWAELDLAGLEAGSVAVEPFVVVVSPTRYLPAPLPLPLLKGFKYFFISCCFQNTHTHTHKLIARKSCAPSPLPLFTCFPLFASLGWPLRYSTVFTLNFVLITLCLLQLATCCACIPLEWVLPLPPIPNPPLLAPRSASLPLAYALDRKLVLCAAYTLPVCPALPLFFLPCPCCTVTPLAAL